MRVSRAILMNLSEITLFFVDSFGQAWHFTRFVKLLNFGTQFSGAGERYQNFGQHFLLHQCITNFIGWFFVYRVMVHGANLTHLRTATRYCWQNLKNYCLLPKKQWVFASTCLKKWYLVGSCNRMSAAGSTELNIILFRLLVRCRACFFRHRPCLQNYCF